MKNPFNKNGKKFGIFFKIFVPMLVLVIFQLSTFLLTSLVSGEFTYIKDYAHSMLIEKTQNRKNYIEAELQNKMSLVIDVADDVDDIVENLLQEENASISDITTDKELNKKIYRETAESLIYLLKTNMVNDAFIILNTGDLYNEDGTSYKGGMLIRDLDPTNNSLNTNQDLLMEFGNSAIAQEFNITLDTEWASKLKVDYNDSNYDFFFKTIEVAKLNSDESLSNLANWSSFSKVSDYSQSSMKYTVPLIDSQGNVYGVIGIGIMETMLLKSLPSNDLINQNACYILGYDADGSGEYSILLHSGSIYTRLVQDTDKIDCSNLLTEENIFEIDTDANIKTIGNLQNIFLYNEDSLYHNQKWALISLADKDDVLILYDTIIDTFFISSIISLLVGIIILVFISRQISTPISNIIQKLNNQDNHNKIIRFSTTKITEIDQLTNAITELQINIKESSSRVSKIISIADVGMGVFTWDYNSDNVFISESLITLLNFTDVPQEDAYITFNQFIKYLSKSSHNNYIIEPIVKIKNLSNIENANINEVKTFSMGNGINRKYFKLNITQDKFNIIGVIQDVTSITLEHKKIEYERDYDLTTGLLNRRAYYKKIERLFAKPNNLKVGAFIMWDLDNLKYVNDTYGHDFGDDYIKTAANVFKQFKSYNGVVARMSGDEFNVFLSGYNSKEEILEVVNKVRDNLLDSYCLLSDGTHYKIRASAGISYYPYDSKAYEMLIKYADFAMYTIKHSTKGALAEFDMSTYNKDSILVTGIEEMNRIIDERSIKYAFQSIISAKTGEIYGYEALMRPQSSVLKSPLELIRIAKTCSKLYKIERLTWIESLQSFHSQIDEGKAPKGTKIFLNSISNCLIDEEDIKYIEKNHKEILSNLVMEILEGEQSNMDFMNTKINLIKKWHGKIALDDFGSGYNNELALITFNPSLIKIDRSIISGCDNDSNRQNIITNLIQIAKAKDILVLAEGVETYEELKTVIDCGVDLIQGYYVGRPVFELQDIPKDIKQQIKNLNFQSDEIMF
ncbi:MAG: EAL domain-containing protein [Ruminococcus sp.]|nr:EAL domain-containing protein [Ruminococcus sp.]